MKTKLVDVTELELHGNRLWHDGREYSGSCRRVDITSLYPEFHYKLQGKEFYRIAAITADASAFWLDIAQPGDKFEVVVDEKD